MEPKIRKQVINYLFEVAKESCSFIKKTDFDTCVIIYTLEKHYFAKVRIRDEHVCEITNNQTKDSFFKKDETMRDAIFVASFFYLQEFRKDVPDINPYQGFNEPFDEDDFV